MRLNIKHIMTATMCTEDNAHAIEQQINDFGLLDWSECSMTELIKVAREAAADLNLV